MDLFGSRRPDAPTRRRGLLHRKENLKDRVAGGLIGSLVNPNTTRGGRRQDASGRERDSLVGRIKRALGIRSTPRRTRAVERTHY